MGRPRKLEGKVLRVNIGGLTADHKVWSEGEIAVDSIGRRDPKYFPQLLALANSGRRLRRDPRKTAVEIIDDPEPGIAGVEPEGPMEPGPGEEPEGE